LCVDRRAEGGGGAKPKKNVKGGVGNELKGREVDGRNEF